MDDWGRLRAAMAVLMALACALLCSWRWGQLEAAGSVRSPVPVLRTCDLPVVRYPATREYAVHGTPVALRFGSETYYVEPTREELRYGMRWSWEP